MECNPPNRKYLKDINGEMDVAIRNEQKWIDIGVKASHLLEQAGLALPAGELREKCLAAFAEIQTTPLYNYKGKPATSDYAALKKHGAYALAFPL